MPCEAGEGPRTRPGSRGQEPGSIHDIQLDITKVDPLMGSSPDGSRSVDIRLEVRRGENGHAEVSADRADGRVVGGEVGLEVLNLFGREIQAGQDERVLNLH